MSWTSSAVGSKADVVTDLAARVEGEAASDQAEGRDSHGALLPTAEASAQAAAVVAALADLLATVGAPDAQVMVSLGGHVSADRLEDVLTVTIRLTGGGT